MFAAFGRARTLTSVSFVSSAALEGGYLERAGLEKRLTPVTGTRLLSKADMIHNAYQPRIEVDPQTYEVRADGELLTCEPLREAPLAQRYFLF
jgi:urease subunit alpha